MVYKRDSLIVLLSLVAATWVFPDSLHGQEEKADPPNLNSILDSLERTAEENPALSRPHEVTREYKVFEGDDPEPSRILGPKSGLLLRTSKHSKSPMRRVALEVKRS